LLLRLETETSLFVRVIVIRHDFVAKGLFLPANTSV
jgi:hypothetical protein